MRITRNMEMNLRADNCFVEDEAWHQAADRYAEFLLRVLGKRVVLLELGVGFNTPVIIRFPFERFAAENADFSLIRLNLNQAFIPSELGNRAIGIIIDGAFLGIHSSGKAPFFFNHPREPVCFHSSDISIYKILNGDVIEEIMKHSTILFPYR